MSSNNNQINVPQAKEAMERFKTGMCQRSRRKPQTGI